MRNYQRERGWRDIMQSRIVLIILGIFVLFFSYSIFGLFNKMQDTEKNKKNVEEKIASLQDQKQKLSSEINNLQTDQGKEKIFRENFGLAKDGEDMIVVVEDKNPLPAKPPASNGFLSFLKSLFNF